LIEGSCPTITLPTGATKQGPVRIIGAASGVFSTNNAVVVVSGGETISGQTGMTLAIDYQSVMFYPLSGGGYVLA